MARGFTILLLAAATVSGPAAINTGVAVRAGQAFAEAREAYNANPDEATNAWNLGRASFDVADLATNSEQRATVARTGIAACRHLLAHDPKSAAAHYYLAMDEGELAEAEGPSMAAYKLIRDIEHEFKLAAEFDERVDFAGPIRCLGLLYRDAPGWPVSIGSKRKAREYLEKAAALAPEYPENQLNLLESQIRWRQASEAAAAWQRLASVWPAARARLSGPGWEPSWEDWTNRRAAAKSDFEKIFKQPLEPSLKSANFRFCKYERMR